LVLYFKNSPNPLSLKLQKGKAHSAAAGVYPAYHEVIWVRAIFRLRLLGYGGQASFSSLRTSEALAKEWRQILFRIGKEK